MSDDASILPANASPYMLALEAVSFRLNEIDADALRRMRDPDQCSVAHLPFLAWGRGVDLWYEDWTEHRKRKITREIYQLKALKGTLTAIEGYLAFVDGRVVQSILPPQAVVARRQDPERLAQWRARFAQLRLYPFKVRGARPGLVPGRLARTVARADVSRLHYGRRATLFDSGAETVLRSIDQVRVNADVTIPVTTFAIPAAGRLSDPRPGRSVPGAMVAGAPRGRLITLAATGAGGLSVPSGFSSVEVLDVTPERIHERHPGQTHDPVAGPRPRWRAGRMVARLNAASRHIYDRWYLLDRERAGGDPYGAVGPTVGRMVPGLSAFHALLRVDARFSGRSTAPVVGRSVPGRVVACAPSDRILRVGAAISRAKALRDTTLFTTKTYRPRTLSDLSFDRPVPFGGMVPILGDAS